MSGLSVPSTMRAWQYRSAGGDLLKNLKLNPSAPVPTPKNDEHLVKITSCALNPIDYKPAEFAALSYFAIAKPATPGLDFAGVIVKPAPGSSLKVGQAVYGVAGTSPLAGGAMREYAIVKPKTAIPIPENVDPVDTSTVGVAGITAYQSIVTHTKAGDSIFINAGSGGTGIFGIQIAKIHGLHVTTTCSSANIELCKSLGADEVIDYREVNVADALVKARRKFDHVVDNVGSSAELIWRGHEFMKPGTKYVLVGGGLTRERIPEAIRRKLLPGFLGGIKTNVVGFWPQIKPEDIIQVVDWIKTGKLKAIIDTRFKFEEGDKAIERLKTGRARGKVVIDVAAF